MGQLGNSFLLQYYGTILAPRQTKKGVWHGSLVARLAPLDCQRPLAHTNTSDCARRVILYINLY